MPVRRLRSLDQAAQAAWRDPQDPHLWRDICAVWNFSRRVAPMHFPPGVYRSRAVEEMNERVRLWERRR